MSPLILALIAALALSAPAATHVESSFAVSIQVSGVRTNEGSVRVDLCRAADFLKDGCPYSGSAPAVVGVTTVVVTNVLPGCYAAQIYHDRNNNHRVDKGPLGIPREDVAFSNDAPLGLHGPSFEKASFQHLVSFQSLSVKLHHFGLGSTPRPSEVAAGPTPGASRQGVDGAAASAGQLQ